MEQVEYRGAWRKPWYHLMITNLETLGMFSDMFAGWFENSGTNYNAFIEALLTDPLLWICIWGQEGVDRNGLIIPETS